MIEDQSRNPSSPRLDRSGHVQRGAKGGGEIGTPMIFARGLNPATSQGKRAGKRNSDKSILDTET